MRYFITLLVTTEQEYAIIDLYRERCWVYIKTWHEKEADLCDKFNSPLSRLGTVTSEKETPMNDEIYSGLNPEQQSSGIIDTSLLDNTTFNILKTEPSSYFDDTEDLGSEIHHEISFTSDTCNYPTESADQTVHALPKTGDDFEGHENLTGVEQNMCKESKKGEKHDPQKQRKGTKAKYKGGKKLIVRMEKVNDTNKSEQLNTDAPQMHGTSVKHNIKASPDESGANENVNYMSGTNKPLKLLVENTGVSVKPDFMSWKMGSNPEQKRFKCSICDKSFGRKYHCKKHLTIHTKKSKQSGEAEVIDTGVDCFKCEICGQFFVNARKLVAHLSKHTGYNPFICKLCNTGFPTNYKLRKHLHAHNKPYCCEKCGKCFSFTSNLKSHMYMHTGTKFPCNICGKVYQRPASLRVHSAVHTGQQKNILKNHMCERCGKSFSMHKQLVRHSLVHTGEKPHQCGTCGKQLARKESLNNHILTHEGLKHFKCSVCFKSFGAKVYLRKHERTHKEERQRFSCEYCQRLFTRSDNLKTHLRLHTKERPYKCDKCGKAFNQAASLRQHICKNAE